LTNNSFVLSARQVMPLLEARKQQAASVVTSLDLGMTRQEVMLDQCGAMLPRAGTLSWEEMTRIVANPEACWLVAENTVRRIHTFSEELQRAYSLLATESAPTVINAGFTMHRIKRSNPSLDTASKIRAAMPVRGRVLDTTTGLGYTAIEAAKTAGEVITIEIDQTVLDIARLNPWSQVLFTHPLITQLVGDSYQEIQAMDNTSFDLVMHDPPSFSLAGELYSGKFYRQVFRVLRGNGRLFHYIGNPESRYGQSVTRGVIRRLKDAGFTRVASKPEAFAVIASKQR